MIGTRRIAGAALVVFALGPELSAQRVHSLPGAPAAAGITVPTPGPGPAPRPDNVLLLVADDLGIDALAAYGGTVLAPTPNLDQLAATGVLFRNAWSQPTCSPTRATLQTGRYGFRTTIGRTIDPFGDAAGLPLEELTLPEMLDLGTGARYAHAAIGKWHLGTEALGGNLAPNLAGYGHFAGSIEGQLPSYTSWERIVDGIESPVTTYATSAAVDDALLWIGQQQQPWFCYVAFQAPHAPFHRPPAELHTRVLPEGEPRPTCAATFGEDPAPFYAAMVEALDAEIGRLLAGIPPLERARTTVIFLGDNGTDACLAALPAKGTLYEGGINVPFIVAGSQVGGPGECHALVNASDVFATVADIAGVDLAEAFPGTAFDSVSLVPYLRRPDRASIRATIHAEFFTPNGPGNPAPLPECPVRSFCQRNFGFDGPGPAALSMCGLPLYGVFGANLVPFRLVGAPPGAGATLRVGSLSPAFVQEYGALVVSSAPSATLAYQAGQDGSVTAEVWTATFQDDLYYQMVVEDPSLPSGYSVSNAVYIDPLWTDMRAVRNERYKLIRFHPCEEELFDLLADPAEQANLLLDPVDAQALAAYEQLSLALDALR